MKTEEIKGRREGIRQLIKNLEGIANSLLNDIIVDLTDEQRKKLKGLRLGEDIQVVGINPDNSIDIQFVYEDEFAEETIEPAQTKIDVETLGLYEVIYLIDYILTKMAE